MKKLAGLLLGLFLIMNNGYSQWIQTDGPYGNSNVSVAFEYDSKYFTSADLCGFFSKSAIESNWNIQSNVYFTCFARSGDSLYVNAHYFSGGISRDKGVKLIDLANPEAAPESIHTIRTKTLAHAGNCLYGGNKEDGFYILSFDGSQLEFYNAGLPTDTLWYPWGTKYETFVSSIEISEHFIYSGTNKGVYRNDPGLSYWEEKNNGLSIGVVAFIEEIQDTLFTAIENEFSYSSDSGESWNLIHAAPSAITSYAKQGNTIYISTSDNGVLASIDNGISWSPFNSGLTDLSVNFISIFESVLMCGTEEDGFFIFENGLWKENNSGMISSLIRSATIANDQIVANDGEKVYALEVGGDWTDISPIVTNDYFGSLNSMNDTLYLSVGYTSSTWPFDSSFIIYSPDDGATWQDLINPVPFSGDDSYRMYCNNSTLYVYEDEKMHYTSNLGLNWTNISLPQQFCNYFYGFIVYNSIPFAAACGNGQLVKLNNNSNWVLSNNGLPTDREPEDLAYCDGALFTHVSVHGMYVSFDSGSSWSYAGNGLDAEFGIRDFTHFGQHLFVTTEEGVFVTSNFGQSWVACNNGLKNMNTSSIQQLNDTLYVGTYGNGIWKRAIEDIGLALPEYNSGHSNIEIFPNPTHKSFSVSNIQQTVDYKLFDNTGKLSKSGILNSSNLINIEEFPKGIYFLRIENKNFTTIKKIIKI